MIKRLNKILLVGIILLFLILGITLYTDIELIQNIGRIAIFILIFILLALIILRARLIE